jgi:peptidylprolyl isomerase
MAASPIPSPPAARPSSRALATVAASCSSSASPSTSTSSDASRRGVLALGAGFLASAALLGPAGDAGATRIEYYSTVGEKLCDMGFAKSGLGYCDVAVGTGVQPQRGELINVSAHPTVSFCSRNDRCVI